MLLIALLSVGSSPSAPVLPEHPTIEYHVEQTMADSGLDSVNKRSPGLRPVHPNIEPSPSPPPDESLPKRVPSTAINREDDRPKGNLATHGDAVLIASLGDGENPELARFAAGESLPPDQGDKEAPIRNETIPGSQAPVKPAVKRLIETAFGASEQRDSHIGRSTRQKIVHQSNDETGDRRPNEGLLTNSPKGGIQVFYTNDTSLPEEVS